MVVDASALLAILSVKSYLKAPPPRLTEGTTTAPPSEPMAMPQTKRVI